MAISDIKKGLEPGRPEKPKNSLMASSQDSAKEKEEERKDLSVFSGKPFLRANELRQWLRRPQLHQETKIPTKEIIEIGQRLFEERDFIKLKEVYKKEKEVERDLNRARNFGERKEKLKELSLIRNLLGKN